MNKESDEDPYQRIYRVITRIPEGKVATYGQIAALAGLPGHARQVGHALAAAPDSLDIPWQRVINAQGEVSSRGDGGLASGFQRHLLEEEGVEFGLRSGRVDLKRFQWDGVVQRRPRKKRA